MPNSMQKIATATQQFKSLTGQQQYHVKVPGTATAGALSVVSFEAVEAPVRLSSRQDRHIKDDEGSPWASPAERTHSIGMMFLSEVLHVKATPDFYRRIQTRSS